MKQYQGNLEANFSSSNFIQGDTLKQNTYQNLMYLNIYKHKSIIKWELE